MEHTVTKLFSLPDDIVLRITRYVVLNSFFSIAGVPKERQGGFAMRRLAGSARAAWRHKVYRTSLRGEHRWVETASVHKG